MHLRSVRLRGFKSFADKTTLEFEPGVTVIVGPNGSGKSNIVDALTWGLGSHSAKSLRGGSMADVIFAGSQGLPALGRASVEITIDNSDGGLPIEFSEVTIARAMFANGENSYAINGTECRLLDVQELLSDTGLGRENHTIVGQGQLDASLNAKPEDRRAFIEEAAGILKHRKRKERALRKIAQMEGHVERLTDLLRELRRNLRPLERQAEAARKHAALAAELRDVRVARAVRELDGLLVLWTEEETAQRRSDDELAASIRSGRPKAGMPPFAAAVAYYGGCRNETFRLATDLLILFGEADDWANVKACPRMMARQDGATKARLALVTYPGAYHDFDIGPRPAREILGHRIEYNEAAAKLSWDRTIAFFKKNLA